MAQGTSEMVDVQLDDYLCPICLEEFNDPKSLPCLHDLCKKCLEDLAARKENRTIRCPLCRSECVLPVGGVRSLPTNPALARMLERSPNKIAKEEIQNALDECRHELANIENIANRISGALRCEGDKIKTQIHETAENIIELVRKQERSLCQEVDSVIVSEEDGHAAAVLIRQTGSLIQDVEEVMERNEPRDIIEDKESLIGHLKDSTSASTKLHHIYHDMELQTSAMNFKRNREFLQCVSSSMFGSVNPRHKPAINSTWLPGFNKELVAGLEILKPGTRFRALKIPSSLESKFHPFAITSVAGEHGVSGGMIAVSDQGGHSVLLFSDNGEFVQRIGARGCDEGKLECPTGVSFLSRHIITVADGCLFGNPSRLQAFDSSGRFIRCLAKLNKNTHWFTHINAVSNQRIIVTCRNVAADYEAYVQVFNTDGTVALGFGATGEGMLINPVKTVYMNGEYFVSDFDKSTNYCMIKVFGPKGRYLRCFGECMLRSDVKDNPSYPLIITADRQRNNILAYSGLYRVIRCYKPDGSLICYYGTISGITDLTLTNDRRLFVTCDGSGDFPHSVQILFHT